MQNKMVLLLLINSCLIFTASAQNYAARVWQSMPADDPMIIAGVPTNSVVSFMTIGTNTTVSAPYIFVGNEAAKQAFFAARKDAYMNWKTNVWDVQVKAQEDADRQQIQILSDELKSSLVTLGQAYNNWATLTANQKDNAQKLSVRVILLWSKLEKVKWD